MRYVRWMVCLAAVVSACHDAPEALPTPSSAVSEVGRIRAKGLDEASGLIASKSHPDIYWTHNDGDDGVLYAIHADGSLVGKRKVNAKFKDWEDIAADADGRLYLADVGNNSRERKHITVYRVDEPDPNSPNEVEVTATYRLAFPGEPFNCEGLFIFGDQGYVISKLDRGERAGVYRFPLLETKKHRVLEKVCDLRITEPVTAADITTDGKRLAVLSERTLSVFVIDGDVKTAADAKPRQFTIPPIQAEGCCFNAEGVLVIAESGEILQINLDEASPATMRASNNRSSGETGDRPSRRA